MSFALIKEKKGCHDDSVLSASISGVVLCVDGGVTVAEQPLSEVPMAAHSLRDSCGLLGKSLASTDSLSGFTTTALAAALTHLNLSPIVTGTLATGVFVTGTVGLAVARLIPLTALNNASFALAVTLEALVGLVAGDFADNTDAGSCDVVLAVTVLVGLIVAVEVTFDLTSSGRAGFILAAAIFAAAAAIGPA